MGTVTRDEALWAFAYCMLMLSRSRRKHHELRLRVPEYIIEHVQEKIYPHWQYLTESERLSFLFAVAERKYMDTKYKGPHWKITITVAWLKDHTAGLAADFIIGSDRRLN